MMALHARAAAALALGATLVTVAFLACSSDSEPDTNPAGADGGGNGEALFRVVQHDLIVRCGGPNGSCHVKGATAPHWLGDPDPYVSAKKYPGILPATRDVGDSTLLTQVAHTGPSLKSFPELYDHVSAWVLSELPQPPLPNTGKFSVATGLNVINLNTIATAMGTPSLDGARISFLASDGAAGTLSLTAIRVQAPMNANIKFDSPFFVTLPRSGKVKAEPSVNGFQGELTVPAGTTVDFYTGKMILTGWDAAGQLKIAFQKVETSVGKGANGACTALDVFKNKALPAFRTMIDITGDDDTGPGNDGGLYDGGVVGQGSCAGCHAKPTADPMMGPTTAVGALDLQAIDSDPAVACGFARNFINFQDKAQSIIILNPTGQANPSHPVKALAPTDPVVVGIRAWVDAEMQ